MIILQIPMTLFIYANVLLLISTLFIMLICSFIETI